jgi:MarR family 2-MHQ and catechol resistance regulon transcriptional repressor
MPTHFSGKANEVRALNTYIKLSRASGSLDARLTANLASRGVTPGQLGVIEALLHLGPLTHGELGRKLLRSGGNVTTVIDNLERRGLVGRQRNRDDRRVVTVSLTSAGRELIAEIFPHHARAVAHAMATLTIAEQEDLGRLCRKLGRGVAQEALRARKLGDEQELGLAPDSKIPANRNGKRNNRQARRNRRRRGPRVCARRST